MTPAEMVTTYAKHGGVDNACSILGVASFALLRATQGAEPGHVEGLLAGHRVVLALIDEIRALGSDASDPSLVTPDILTALELEGVAR